MAFVVVPVILALMLQHQLLEDLERSERRFRRPVEGSPAPTVLRGPERIRYTNERPAVTGRPLSGFLPERDAERVHGTIVADNGPGIRRLGTRPDRRPGPFGERDRAADGYSGVGTRDRPLSFAPGTDPGIRRAMPRGGDDERGAPQSV